MKTKTPDKKMPRVARKRSRTSGLGLYALEPIRKGTGVAHYTGEIISEKESDRRGGKYLFELSKNRVIDGKGRDNLARYINHSCKPNCEPIIKRDHVLIRATKAIATGEELTYDYGEDYFEEFIKPHGCKCTSCRSKIQRKKRPA